MGAGCLHKVCVVVVIYSKELLTVARFSPSEMLMGFAVMYRRFCLECSPDGVHAASAGRAQHASAGSSILPSMSTECSSCWSGRIRMVVPGLQSFLHGDLSQELEFRGKRWEVSGPGRVWVIASSEQVSLLSGVSGVFGVSDPRCIVGQAGCAAVLQTGGTDIRVAQQI